jgi:hypothetical protein
MAAGSSQFCLSAGSHFVRIELVSGDLSRVDLALVLLDPSPVVRTGWGAIKALFR